MAIRPPGFTFFTGPALVPKLTTEAEIGSYLELRSSNTPGLSSISSSNLISPWSNVPPITPPFSSSTDVPGLFISKDLKTYIKGDMLTSLSGVGMYLSIASITASILSLCWAEIGIIGASRATVSDMKDFILWKLDNASSSDIRSNLFWAITMCFKPSICNADRCSLVWGRGTSSSAAMTKTAPSMTAAPESMFVIRASWPGQSTKLTTLKNSALPPHLGHLGDVE